MKIIKYISLILIICTLFICLSGCNVSDDKFDDFSFEMSRLSCEINNVVYYMTSSSSKLLSYNLLTKTASSLCKDPLCEHNTGSCADYYSAITFNVITDGYNVYFLSTALLDAKPYFCIFKYNVNDSTVKLIYKWESASGQMSLSISADSDENGYIYFPVNIYEDKNNSYQQIYKIKKDGSGDVILCLDKHLTLQVCIAVYDEYLFYTDSLILYCYNCKTGELKKIGKDISFINVYDDKLYCMGLSSVNADNINNYDLIGIDIKNNFESKKIYAGKGILGLYFNGNIFIIPADTEFLGKRNALDGEGVDMIDVYKNNRGNLLIYSNDPETSKEVSIDGKISIQNLIYADDKKIISSLIFPYEMLDNNFSDSGMYFIDLNLNSYEKILN